MGLYAYTEASDQRREIKKPAQRPVRNYLSNLSKSAVKTGSKFGATVNGKVPETGPLNNCGD